MTEQTDVMQAKIRDTLFDHVTDKEGWSLPEPKALFTAETAIAVAMLFAHPPADQRLREALEVVAAGEIDISDTAIIVGNGASTVMRQIHAALAAPLDDRWLPIGDAPKDGTRFLGWLDIGIAMPFAWENGRWMGDDYPLTMAALTHFRPLPSAPTSPILSIGEGM